MRPSLLRPLVTASLSGLLLAACGGAPEELVPAEEQPGTQQSALCSGLSVTDLSIGGISTWQGEMAGSGPWAVSTGANAVRLEYYVDGALRSIEDRTGGSGTWYFSTTGIACGTRNFTVKAFPMVVDSAGNRTVCLDVPRSVSQAVTEACPVPSVSMTCARATSTAMRCTGSATGGSGSYTPYWQEWEYGYPLGWYSGAMIETFFCPTPSTTASANTTKKAEFKVIDSNGTASAVVSRSFSCRDDMK
ncbi:MAG TPA: hypothetical protein VFZ09_21270 [Archangium sp.]|uniref:hypothetical protein n=1 Tax=Archangium sp. TaxID=1872627 RepID=UPI002E367968|nr:hypothetical protein [Archangium sp.]HEX5748786.1 hypothetical protein [Archangium sp.]